MFDKTLTTNNGVIDKKDSTSRKFRFNGTQLPSYTFLSLTLAWHDECSEYLQHLKWVFVSLHIRMAFQTWQESHRSDQEPWRRTCASERARKGAKWSWKFAYISVLHKALWVRLSQTLCYGSCRRIGGFRYRDHGINFLDALLAQNLTNLVRKLVTHDLPALEDVDTVDCSIRPTAF